MISANWKNFISASAVLLIVFFTSCNNDDPSFDPVVTADYYFKGEIDGNLVVWQHGDNGYGSGAGASSYGANNCQEEQSMNLLKSLSSENSISVGILKTFSTCATDCSQLKNMYSTSSYSYGEPSDGSTSGIDGVVVYYYDQTGKLWTSYYGSGNQSGSTFKITEHVANNDAYSEMVSTAEFECVLYDDNGNSIDLKNGLIKSRSIQCGHL